MGGRSAPAEVGTAIVEANGTISAFPGAQSRPPRASELGIAVEEEGLPLMLVLDGKPQWHNLARGGHSRAWLQGMLSSRGIAFEQVYLGQLDARDRVTLQLRRGDVVRFQAPEEGTVNG